MRVCVLGPLVVQDGTTDVAAGGPIQRRLLARLAMDAGRQVSLDDLEQAAWGDDPPLTARHTLATYVFRLRRLGLAIRSAHDGYILETPTDIGEFDALASASRSAAQGHDPQRAAVAIRAALALRRGQPLLDLADLTEATIAAARLDELVESLREELLTLELDRARPADLIAQARQLAAEQPYRERRWELLMLVLYRAGRQAEALDAYAECRRRLLDDLGLDPGMALRRMQQAVLAQDPALDPPVRVVQAAGAETEARGATRRAATPEPNRVPGTSTRLIGRASEQRDLAEAWQRSRLVTLLGPPGAGKTRLALELARTADPPVWYVGLEQLPASQSVAGAILDVVAPSSRAADAAAGVASALSSAPALLV